MTTPLEIVNKFFDTWNDKDIEAMAKLLNDDMTYEGPLFTWSGKQEYLEGAKQILPGFGGMKVIKQYVDGNSVLSIIDITLNTPDGAITFHNADQTEVVNGKLSKTKTYFDPRKIEKYCVPTQN